MVENFEWTKEPSGSNDGGSIGDESWCSCVLFGRHVLAGCPNLLTHVSSGRRRTHHGVVPWPPKSFGSLINNFVWPIVSQLGKFAASGYISCLIGIIRHGFQHRFWLDPLRRYFNVLKRGQAGSKFENLPLPTIQDSSSLSPPTCNPSLRSTDSH